MNRLKEQAKKKENNKESANKNAVSKLAIDKPNTENSSRTRELSNQNLKKEIDDDDENEIKNRSRNSLQSLLRRKEVDLTGCCKEEEEEDGEEDDLNKNRRSRRLKNLKDEACTSTLTINTNLITIHSPTTTVSSTSSSISKFNSLNSPEQITELTKLIKQNSLNLNLDQSSSCNLPSFKIKRRSNRLAGNSLLASPATSSSSENNKSNKQQLTNAIVELTESNSNTSNNNSESENKPPLDKQLIINLGTNETAYPTIRKSINDVYTNHALAGLKLTIRVKKSSTATTAATTFDPCLSYEVFPSSSESSLSSINNLAMNQKLNNNNLTSTVNNPKRNENSNQDAIHFQHDGTSAVSHSFATKKKKKNKKKKKHAKRSIDDLVSNEEESEEDDRDSLNDEILNKRYETRQQETNQSNESSNNLMSLTNHEPINHKRLRLIVGNDTISIDIPQNS